MPIGNSSNLDRLQQEGLIFDDLPEPYVHAVEGLTPHEVETLVAIHKRLQAADKWHLGEPGGSGLPHYTTFMVF